MTVTPRHAAALLLGVCMMLATGCNPETTPTARSAAVTGTAGCQVGVVGDSLTLGARDAGHLVEEFNARGCEVTAVDARKGRPTSEGVAVIDTWAAAEVLPRVLVVGLGTNDCNAAAFDRQVHHVLDQVGKDRPVVWINTWRPGCDRQLNDALFAIQAQLNDRPDGGNLWILNHWQWIYENRQLLAGDGIHLTANGYRAHASRIVDAVTG